MHPNFESRERTSNDQRDVHPPEAVVVEFGQEDIVCNDSVTVGGEDTGNGDGDW